MAEMRIEQKPSGYLRFKDEWFRIITPDLKRHIVHRSCMKFMKHPVYPEMHQWVLDLTGADKKFKYLRRYWRRGRDGR